MAFIRTIDPAVAECTAREMYEHEERRLCYIPNWSRPFSLHDSKMNSLNFSIVWTL